MSFRPEALVSARPLFVAVTLASVALVGATASCTDDTSSSANPPDSGAPSSALDGAASSSGSSGAAQEAGTTPEGGTSNGTIPGSALAFPVDVALLTKGRPLNIDTTTDVIVSGSLQYETAYEQGALQDDGAYFRFTERTHDAPDELPPGGVRVWWRRIRDDGSAGNFVCWETNDLNGIVTLKSNGMAGSEAEPDGVWRDQCSWTLWRHPTEDGWYIRAPKGTSTEEGGTFVVEKHGTANEGYRIRVDGASFGLAPVFRFKSKM